MNIFATSPDPVLCAQALDDKRLRRTLLETGVMVSMAANRLYGQEKLYMEVSPRHSSSPNHPINVWVRRDDANFLWTVRHFIGLNNEHSVRFHTDHNSRKVLESGLRSVQIIGRRREKENMDLPDDPLEFVNYAENKSLGISFKHLKDVHEAYRQYLNFQWNSKREIAKWTQRAPPCWSEKK